MAKLIEVEGIGPVYAEKLKTAGITTISALLEMGSTPKGRKSIAEKAGISDALVLRWVNHVDLFRVTGIGEEYSDLLERAGVDTVVELAQRNADNLHQTLVAANEEQKRVRKLPTPKESEAWVKQAKRLPRTIKY